MILELWHHYVIVLLLSVTIDICMQMIYDVVYMYVLYVLFKSVVDLLYSYIYLYVNMYLVTLQIWPYTSILPYTYVCICSDNYRYMYIWMLLSSAIDAAICRSLFYLYMRMFAYSKYVCKYFGKTFRIDNYRYKYILLLIVMTVRINIALLLLFIASSILLSAYRYLSIYICKCDN